MYVLNEMHFVVHLVKCSHDCQRDALLFEAVNDS